MKPKPFHTCDRFAIQSAERPSGFRMQNLHSHITYELYFLEKGQHNCIIGNNLYQISAQDVVLFRPNVLHKSHDTKGHTRTCVYFTDEFLHEYYTDKALNNLLHCFEKDIITLDNETYHKIQKLLSKIKKEDLADSSNQIFMYCGEILRILTKHMNDPRKEPSFQSSEKLTPIFSYIADNYKDINGLDEIAARFYISTSYLCRVFKKHTGMTISHYINQIKIQHACELLANTDKTTTAIAYECGFNSSMYFCKTFKEQMGCSPSEFRNSTTE